MFRKILAASLAVAAVSGLAGCANSPLAGPDVQARSTDKGLELAFGPTFFDYKTATLRPDGERQVKLIARLLWQKPQRPVIIEGHADDIGSETYNLGLSMDRANAVKQALVNHGIDGDRLLVLALGETFPVAYNASENGRARNRRVEVIIR